MTTKKMEEFSEIEKVFEEYDANAREIHPVRSMTSGDNVDCENGKENRLDGEKLTRYVLYSQRHVNSQQRRLNIERDRMQEKLDSFVMQSRCDKKALLVREKARIADMKALIEKLKADNQINLALKQKKIMRCEQIIKDSQWTINQQVAYMQKANQR